jgi:hypothetical protein
MTQNRSPAFAPAFDAGDMESMRVLTAGYPAEYGRKLGGVIELMTEKNPPTGWHGRMEVGGGSFDSLNGAGEIDYSSGKNHFELGGQGFHTDRFLDPPVLDNFTNWANGNGLSAAYERDFSTWMAIACASPSPAANRATPCLTNLCSSRPGSARIATTPKSAVRFISSTLLCKTEFGVFLPAFAMPVHSCVRTTSPLR